MPKSIDSLFSLTIKETLLRLLLGVNSHTHTFMHSIAVGDDVAGQDEEEGEEWAENVSWIIKINYSESP